MSDTLRRLQQLHQAATPGPWKVRIRDEDGERWVAGLSLGDNDFIETDGGYYGPNEPNAALIAAMRNALPALLKVAEAAERAVSARRVFEDEDDAGDGYEDGAFYAWQAAVDDLREALAALNNT